MHLNFFLIKLDPAASFWKNLESYALSSYDNDDTDFLIQVLQDELDSKMQRMSLDDLERLATHLSTASQ
jgi:hypothetical protein